MVAATPLERAYIARVYTVILILQRQYTVNRTFSLRRQYSRTVRWLFAKTKINTF